MSNINNKTLASNVVPKKALRKAYHYTLNNLKDIYNYEEPYENVVLTGLVALYEICFEQ